MKTSLITVLVVLTMAASVYAAEGMIDVESAYGVEETADRLDNVLKEKGMTIPVKKVMLLLLKIILL